MPSSLMCSLVDESLDAVLIIDEDCIVRYANQSMQNLSGYSGEELVGKSLDALLPGAMASCHTGFVRTFTRGEAPSAVLGKVREFAIRDRNGIVIPIEMKAIDIGQHEGRRYFGAFIEDLRPRRTMEAQNAALLARLEQEAMTDPLTGIANRRAFAAEGDHMLVRARRSGAPVVVGIADIDHFKKINDENGHPAGDTVLRAVAQRMTEAARASDFVARIGGEEFGLLFPDTHADAAVGIAQRIRESVAASPIETDDGRLVHATISIGLTQISPAEQLDDGLATADCALYNAKNGGRNRVESI
ncbi:sensor domain-containing diguanylate cyclase [Massilia soli]|uniref:sensor domain-containing diguanylate cyclase n=1 Tax=Massilia soli TaxID=2792854 RepID=UPI001CBE6BFC|nr:sensor domain-containing diguanylate cyclase [Massilia soli]